MSGVEPILIGAALGAGASGAMGGNPLQGALMGAAGGGLGAAAGGLGGAASGAAAGGTAGAATGAAGAGTAAGLTGGSAGSIGAAQAIPVAMQAPIAATPLTAVGTTGATTGALTGNLVADMAAMDAAMAATGEGFAQTAGLGGGLLDKIDPMMLAQAGSLFGDGKSQQQRVSAPSVRAGKAPQIQQPIDELMRMQMMAQRQRRPISLL